MGIGAGTRMHAEWVGGDSDWPARRRPTGGPPVHSTTVRAGGRPRHFAPGAPAWCCGHALGSVGIQGDEVATRAVAGGGPGGPVLRRQAADVPPPPPPYPHYTQMFFGAVPEKIGELEITCSDRRERGFWIYWNTGTGRAFPGDITIGEPAPTECSKPAEIDLGPMPRDRGSILLAGWFHNHPPMRPGCTQLEIGPSHRDKQTSKDLRIPGMVQDFTRTGPNTDCKRTPRGTFFFGPERREV